MICYLGRVVAVRNAAVCWKCKYLNMQTDAYMYKEGRKEGRSKGKERHRSGQQKGTDPGAREVRGLFQSAAEVPPAKYPPPKGSGRVLITLDTLIYCT